MSLTSCLETAESVEALLQDFVQGVRELLQAPQPPSCMQELHGMRESLGLEHNPPWELQPRGVE